ncbi:DNA glycosylase AlkZ-like family protein [Hamadaea tsunoensis]|uniref:DNA glycosylase AlkZ-like family protein n=1 Tax=Hamadaea tsunoensis TaxID=53368 RepID=UPI000408051C|nr:crosslink repair DNA glycosylase YcaQ family protein [Hamadaea tsunoensis]
MTPHQLTREQARRIAVRAQLLAADRPADLLTVVRRLTLLQLDPTAAIAPNADLVLFSRLGSAYRTAELADHLRDRRLVELNALIRPAEDITLYRAEMAAFPEPGLSWQAFRAEWIRSNDACRRDILDRLARSGPLPSRALPDTCVVPWESTGWTNDRNVTQMLEFLSTMGQVAIAGRQGRQRLWDLAAKVYPDDPVVPAGEALARRNERRLRALGIARAKTAQMPVEPADVGDAGEPAVVEGVKGQWRVDPEQLGQPFTGRAALLSPFDRLVHERRRLAEIFAFEYQLEMYKPAAQRRWGYFALPILFGDRLVGKLDAAADRKAGVLRVTAVHEDEKFTRQMRAEIGAEIKDLARWLELDLRLPD